MAYTFSGVFSDGNQQVMADLLTEVSGVGRLIEHPFRGFGVQFGPDRYSQQSADGFPLVSWSRRFPKAMFVYLYVECFGGTCDHAGFVFRDGQVLENIALDESNVSLRQLLKYLCVEFGQRTFFAPLQRGFFEHAIDS